MKEELKKEFLDRVKEYIESKDIEKIEYALEYAFKYENCIEDNNKQDYLSHVLRTAIILTELHSDIPCLEASLIGWIPSLIEGFDIETLKEDFEEEIVNIVKSLQKISKLKLKSEDEGSAIYLRKAIVGLSTDYRVIIIKLASRLDNLRTVYTTPSIIQKNKCIETENVLIPIAHRLGINYIKSELEDLCLKYLKPDKYEEILEYLNASYDELNGYIEEMKTTLSEVLCEQNIKFRIKGRVKSVHSLYQKLSKGKKWKDIYDVLALRIIVEKESECYLAIGLIHAKYRPIPKRFKDYIARPKENMYQSLHTGVIGPEGKVFEIQIRTEEMDEIAECGIASHWSYKEHGTKAIQALMEQKLEIFREAIEEKDKDDDLLDEFKEIFVDKMIYVFTPKGDVIELPEGSTPVDFAYRIHSKIGDTLTDAIVNDTIVPLDYKLKTDDIVKVNTNASSTPNQDWLSFVVTNQAKGHIKSYFNKHTRDEYIKEGEDLLIKEIRRRGLKINECLSDENLEKISDEFKIKDLEDLYFQTGSHRYTAKYVINALTKEKLSAEEQVLNKISNKEIKEENYKNDVIVKGCDNVLITMANCCKPVFGEKIVGYITKGNGITVHKEDCTNLVNMESRLIDVSWNTKTNNNYTTRLLIKTNNINNSVLDIVTKSSQRNLSIEALNTLQKGDKVDYEILVKVPDTDTLKQFMLDLETLSFVNSVEREIK